MRFGPSSFRLKHVSLVLEFLWRLSVFGMTETINVARGGSACAPQFVSARGAAAAAERDRL